MSMPFGMDIYAPPTRSTLQREPNAVHDPKESASSAHLSALLLQFNAHHTEPNFDCITLMNKMSDLMEAATDEFLKKDPDPLDDRHPYRTHPGSAFGSLLKQLFRNEDFMNKLVVSYLLGRDNIPMNEAAARLLLDCVPGLDSSVIFSEPDDLIPTLYQWAQRSESQMLKAYAMGLLGAAMEVADTASKCRSMNMELIPVAIARLRQLQDEHVAELDRAEAAREEREQEQCERRERERGEDAASPPGPFAGIDLNGDSRPNGDSLHVNGTGNGNIDPLGTEEHHGPRPRCTSLRVAVRRPTDGGVGGGEAERNSPPPRKRRKSGKVEPVVVEEDRLKRGSSVASFADSTASESNWHIQQRYLIGSHKVFPLTTAMHQRLILQYLAPTGEYQDLLSLSYGYEGGAMDLLFRLIDVEKTNDIRLTFDALKYLASLLVHRKFALDFVARGGVEALLKVPCASLANVGVATCLYYLAYNADVMEKVCQLEDALLDELIEYALWVLEHSHESGMASASMFFTHGFYFRAVLDRFDQRDGLRKLYNYISTLTLLQDSVDDEELDLSEEQMHTSTQTVRNACAAFRSYATAHLYVKLDQLRRAGVKASAPGLSGYPAGLLHNTPPSKSMHPSEEFVNEGCWLLAHALRSSSSGWRMAEELRRLGVLQTMLQVMVHAQNWTLNNGRCEMARNALDVVWISSCLPRVQLDLCEMIAIGGDRKTQPITILLELTCGEMYEEADIQAVSLNVIINCVCTPPEKTRVSHAASRAKKALMPHPHAHAHREKEGKEGGGQKEPTELLDKMWAAVRKNNGIMILNRVVRTTTPRSDADVIRTIACRALNGLARHPEVRQMLSRMPLIAGNELHGLMREPVSPDRRVQHHRFCQEAKGLIETVTQKSIMEQRPSDLTHEKLWKNFVVSNTKISFNEKELLQLIHGHLVSKGLVDTASQLRKEADLPDVPASRMAATPSKIKALPSSSPSFVSSVARPSRSLRVDGSCVMGGVSGVAASPSAPATPTRITQPVFATPTPNQQPGRLRKQRDSSSFPRRLQLRTPQSSNRVGEWSGGGRMKPHKGLTDIVTDYFRVQHSLCSNPVTTCPPFSLFYPHRCPEPTSRRLIPVNMTSRVMQGDIMPFRSRFDARRGCERFMFGRFRPARTFQDHEEMYTTAAFSIDDEHLIVGMYTGDVHWMNVETGVEQAHTQCHQSAITGIQPSKDGSLLLTSSAFVKPMSSLWRLGERQEHVYDLSDEYHVLFANVNQDRLVGTNGGRATVYDVETGRALQVFQDEGAARYRRNRAEFSPCDRLILNDGAIWDVRMSGSNPLHSFDKLNQTLGGCFHPHGNEVIINKEVWDVRSFGLLRTVPVLEQCKIVFNSTGNVLYAAAYDDEEDDAFRQMLSSSFRTLDASTYEVLTTMDTRRPLLDMCADHSDTHCAVVEMLRADLDGLINNEESHVRMWEVGKRRDEDDDEGDEEAEDDEDGDGDDDGSMDSEDSQDSISSSEDDDPELMNALMEGESGEDDSDVDDELVEQEEGDRVGGESSSDGEGEEEEEGDGNSSGWETASNQDDNARIEGDDDGSDSDPFSEGDAIIIDEDEEEEGEGEGGEGAEGDGEYRVDPEEEHQSSSSTVLNPNLRRKRRRED